MSRVPIRPVAVNRSSPVGSLKVVIPVRQGLPMGYDLRRIADAPVLPSGATRPLPRADVDLGAVFDLDGANDGFSGTAFPDLGNNFSAACWVRSDDAAQGDTFALAFINGNQGSNRDFKFLLGDDGSGNFRSTISDSTNNHTAGAYDYGAGERFHVGLSWDNADLKFYINGLLNATNNVGAFTTFTSSNWSVGGGLANGISWSDNWDGIVSDCLSANTVWSAPVFRYLSNAATRWNIYAENRRKSYFFVPPVAAVGGNPLASSLMTMGVGF